jgi:two-component system, cell cycle response regulator
VVQRADASHVTVLFVVVLIVCLALSRIERRRSDDLVAQLHGMATIDGLTGVANRRTFEIVLAREVARAQRTGTSLALIVVDLDHFKAINDTYGHEVGDQVLRHVGAALSSGCRGVDLAARFGGEEFVVIVPGASVLGVTVAAERFRTLVAHGAPVECSASAGVAVYPDLVSDPSELLAAADEALYEAKSRGRNRTAMARSRVPRLRRVS